MCHKLHSCSSGQPFPAELTYLNGLLHPYNPLGVLTTLCGTHNAQACRPTPIVSICSSVFVLVTMVDIYCANYVDFL